MKQLKITTIVIAIMALSLGCKKNAEDVHPAGHYLVTGYISGFCAQPCSYFYLVQNGELRKSGAVLSYKTNLAYNTLATTTEYGLVQNLESLIPDTLYNFTDKSFGCPNCHDQGGYYLTISKNNQLYQWRLDPDLKDSTGHFLQPFVVHLRTLYGQLSQ